MLTKVLLVGCFLFGNSLVFAQLGTPWPCADGFTEGNSRIRVSSDASAGLAEKKVLPDVSDLKGTKTSSTVVVRVLTDKNGDVQCAEAWSGDASLFQRSRAAMMQWHFKPYLLNGQPFFMETVREFVFKKGKVTAR